MYHFGPLSGFTTIDLSANGPTGPLLSKVTKSFEWTDANSIAHSAMITLMYVRFSAANTTSGAPFALGYHATYGLSGTTVYAASYITAFCGITLSANTVAAGDYGWVQVGGPNMVAMTSAGAIAQFARFEHNGAATDVKTVATDANTFGYLVGTALGGAGAIPIGAAFIGRPWGTN